MLAFHLTHRPHWGGTETHMMCSVTCQSCSAGQNSHCCAWCVSLFSWQLIQESLFLAFWEL